MTKKALITGITGQDGSYLAEFLLEQGYEVIGLVRRTSTINFERIGHIQEHEHLHIVSGDLLDLTSLIQVLDTHRPQEVYNLAAQSFVPTSWEQPVLTGEVTALGVTRMLDAIRMVDPTIRFYQASSSEMFGKVVEVPQKETTPFYPRSPYGVAKVYGHWITVNYRESYGMHTTSGILFNHECVTAETPIFTRQNGLIDLHPIEDIVPHRSNPRHAPKYSTEPSNPIEIWDASGWTQVTCMTATWNGYQRKANKVVNRIEARGAVYQATDDHIVFTCEDGQPVEREVGQVQPGDDLAFAPLPQPTNAISMTEDEAWLLGVLVADGSINDKGKIKVANQDQAFIDEIAATWQRVTGGASGTYMAASGFENGRDVIQLRLTGARSYGRYIHEQIYTTRSNDTRIPKRILNGSYEARMAFLRGFNAGDGLKAGSGTYEFKSFKTSSATMASGLYWLALTTLSQRAIICVEERGDKLYYQINLNSPDTPGNKGAHLRKPLEEVKRTTQVDYKGWLFDLATETGTFHAGVGQGWMHNSPRRGLEFVTHKVTDHAARIKLGLIDELRLGNLDARRDWGFALDYVRAMWLMLQQDEPDDYVVATGQTWSVEQLVETAFEYVDLDWRDYVVQDPRFMRPAEVDLLVGDPTKAGEKLGWEPQTSFQELIHLMVDADLARHSEGETE